MIEVAPTQAGGAIATLRSDESIPQRPAPLQADRTLQDLVPQLIPATYASPKFVKPEQVIFPAADGLQIHGQLFMPALSTTASDIPRSSSSRRLAPPDAGMGFHPMQYYAHSYAMNQYLASLGYIVLSVNYRSGIGYGLDFREALNYGRGGASEYNDILGTGKYLLGRADVDPKKIGVWGGSYGGFMTALALARCSDIFAAGVDMHGVHEWLRPASWKPTHDPVADAKYIKTLWDSSPMAYISTWRSPVLLIQGDDDRNVPFLQTVTLARALRKQGVEFCMELALTRFISGFSHQYRFEAIKPRPTSFNAN